MATEDGSRRNPRVDAYGVRPARAFRIETREAPPRVTVIALAGELDMAAAPEVRAAVDRAVAAERVALVLDLSETTFLDSSMLKELLRGDAELRARGSVLVIAAVGQVPRRLLELTRAWDLLQVAATVEDALERVGAGPWPGRAST